MTLSPKTSRPNMPGYGLKPADEGFGLKPWSYAVERLTRARGYWLSTTCENGDPHSMPIWGIWSRDHFVFSTAASSRKARNIARHPRVVVGAEPSDDAIVLEGVAFPVDDSAWRSEIVPVYAAKYGMGIDPAEPVYAVRPTRAFSFSTAPGDFEGGSTRWTF
jgi:hypothetical protein